MTNHAPKTAEQRFLPQTTPETHPSCTLVSGQRRAVWVLPNGLAISRHPGATWIFDLWASVEAFQAEVGLLLTGTSNLAAVIDFAEALR